MEERYMQSIKRWTPWLLLCLLALVAIRAVAQSGPAQQPAARTIGRYAIYYRSADYSQVLLVDTTTGSVWELATTKYQSIATGHEGETVPFRTFQRIGVEGIYQSIPDKILNQQLNQQYLDKLKDPDHP
jgi:hypothetical protein